MNDALLVTLLESFTAWAQAHPLAAALGAAAVPILALIVAELLGARGAQAEPAAQREARAPAPPRERSSAAPAAAETATAARPASRAEVPTAAEAPPAPEPAAPEAAPRPARPSLAARLARTHEALVGRLERLLGGGRLEPDVLDELEALLFSADLGVATAEGLLEEVKQKAAGGDAATVRGVLRDAILARLRRVEGAPAPAPAEGELRVVLVLGVNGSGKTTTIGKLAARYAAEGKRVVVGAADTFRAAATEQLEVWAERVGCEIVKGQEGGDPAAVAFDTVKAAQARGAEVAIVDTAGRLQTRGPLVEELRKIVRVVGRALPGAPHETLLVLDANTGQNAISQARVFTEAAGVTGLVLTKLDGTAKGGVLVGLADEFGIPVRYVGVGEAVEDLRDFSAEEFVDALFEERPEGSA